MDLHRFDAVVVGGGMAGAAAAAHLAPGRRVALLEAEGRAGYHSTGRSAAIWIQNYGPPDVRALTGRSRAFFEAPPPGFADAPLMARRPVAFLAPEDQRGVLDGLLASGIGLEPVDPGALRALVPVLRGDYAVAAAIERDAFDLDVAAIHQGFLRAVTRAGGVVALNRRARTIARAGGAWRVGTEGDGNGAAFEAPLLINAAGAWGDAVARAAGVAALGLAPKRRTAAIVDAPPAHAEASWRWPMLNDAAHTWYVRPEARGRLLVSPADETDAEPGDAAPDEYDVAVAIDRMQRALDVPVRRVGHAWAGLRTFTPDRSLAIGFGAEAGFLWAVGQGGYGIQTAPAAGALVAALADGADPGLDPATLAAIDPRRFAR